MIGRLTGSAGWPDSGAAVRWLALAGGSAVAVLGACGVLNPVLFSEPSLTKYVVTVVAPALLAMLAMVRMPVRVLVGLCILLAPVAFVTTFDGLRLTPLVCLLVLCTLLAAGGERTDGMGWLGYGTVAAVLLLLPAIASSAAVATFAIWLAETVVMGWLVYIVARQPGGVRFVVMMIVASIGLQGLLTVYEYRTGHQLNLYNQSGVTTLGSNYFFSYGSAKRYTGTMPDPIALGNVLALGLPLTICLAAWDRRSWMRIGLAAVGIVTSLGLILSLSRESWIAAVVGSVICLLLLPQSLRWRTGLGVGAVAAAAVVVGVGLGGAALSQRITSVLNPTNVQSRYATTAAGDQLRIRLWVAAIRTAEAKPVTGSGFGKLVPDLNQHGVSVPPAAHAQSWYLEILGEAGVLGAAALLCWILAAVRDLWVAFARWRTLAAGAAGSLAAVLITWTTDIEPRYVQVSAIIAALFGLIAALGAARPLGDEDLPEMLKPLRSDPRL